MTSHMVTLEQLATEYKEPLDEMLPRVIAEEGSVGKAAARLGVWPNSIHNWIDRNGYQLKSERRTWLEKIETPRV